LPFAFLAGLLRARLARSAVADLMIDLREDPAPGHLRDALARAVGDPSLRLAFWLPKYETYADVEGRSIMLPEGDRWATTLIERNGERVAALAHDASLGEEPALLDAVGAAAGIALENARLQAELRASLVELMGSRARVIEAGSATSTSSRTRCDAWAKAAPPSIRRSCRSFSVGGAMTIRLRR
jgi:hypothetical protein